jgi:ABC-type dipeptide/oligopeptide/nickel transport system permease component
MAAFIARRLLWLPIVLFFVSVITLALGLYGPGNPVQVMMGLRTDPAIVERLNREYGFDQPFYVQYVNYIANALQGNFGYGLVKYRDQPVGRLIAERLPVTIQLNFVALILGSVVGIPLGLAAGYYRNSWFDYLARTLSLVAVSIPLLFLLPFLSYLVYRPHEFVLPFLDLKIQLGPFLPSISGYWDGVLSPKAILPILIESMGFVAVLIRQMRAGMIEVLGQDYVRTARAKGLRERLVVVRHAMRNALIPIATILGLSLGGLVEGSFLVENWFGIPGVGQLAFDAFASREYYVIIGLVLIIAVAYVAANMLVDLIYPILDPRIRKI